MKNLLIVHKKLFKHPVFIIICVAVILWGLLAYMEIIEYVQSFGIRIGEMLAG
jgi:hypothetical protein